MRHLPKLATLVILALVVSVQPAMAADPAVRPAAAAAERPQDRTRVPDRPPGPCPAAALRYRPGERPGAAVLSPFNGS